jgi:starch phosphorylase
MIREWIQCAWRQTFRRRVVFLEDYDILLAQELVQGVDVWINTPRRPWEACGTSGMKVVVNGGLNLSELDGWWEEAYAPHLGWAIGDGPVEADGNRDSDDAAQLYTILENNVSPEFYDRDASGLPRAWLTRVRASMERLTPVYNSARVVQEYLTEAYLPAAQTLRERVANGGRVAREISSWERRIREFWSGLHIGPPSITRVDNGWDFAVPVYLGEMEAGDVHVEIYADPRDDGRPDVLELTRGEPIAGATNGYIYSGVVESLRSSDDFTARVVPYYPGVEIPTEVPLVLWQR